MPQIDTAFNMTPAVGRSISEIAATNSTINSYAANDPKGDFRTLCVPSHMSNNDPVVFPNQEGAAHHHTFFGNTSIDHASDLNNLPNVGNSSCSGGTANRSAYWIPSMINTNTGKPIEPIGFQAYYKTQNSNEVVAIPAGLRMIGDASLDPNNLFKPTFSAACLDANDDVTQLKTNTTDGFPVCAIGETLRVFFDFPQCWDGVNLDSADHKSHMAHPESYDGPDFDTPHCPLTHPVHLPVITYNVLYEVDADLAFWRLSSDVNGEPAGSSMHGDWVNGWDATVMQTFVDSCLVDSNDCHTDLLGDGTTLVT